MLRIYHHSHVFAYHLMVKTIYLSFLKIIIIVNLLQFGLMWLKWQQANNLWLIVWALAQTKTSILFGTWFKWLCLINSHSQHIFFFFEESEHIIAHHPIHIIFLLLTSILSTFYVRQHFFSQWRQCTTLYVRQILLSQQITIFL
jgi:hypothetical protein